MFFSSPTYNPQTDIPPLNQKVIIITGANSGLGLASVIHLAKHSPSKIYLCTRSQSKYDEAMKSILPAIPAATAFVQYLELDLSSLSSIKLAAETFLAENERLDILMCNAGIMAQPPGLTGDGFEVQFGVNHMGHALLTKLLLPLLNRTAARPESDVRVVTVSSDLHRIAPQNGVLFDECLTDMAAYSTWTRYGMSKLANILFTKELARRYPTITCVAVHPGAVATNLMDRMIKDYWYITTLMMPFWKVLSTPADVGAWNQVWAATGPVEGLMKS